VRLKKVAVHPSIDEEEYKSYITTVQSDSLRDPLYTLAFETPYIKNEGKLEFLYQLWVYFMEQGLRREAVATESLIYELVFNRHQGHMLLNTSSPYMPYSNTNSYYLESTREIISRLTFETIDFIEAQFKNILLNENVQGVINGLHLPALHGYVGKWLDHFGDLLEKELSIIDRILIDSDLYNLVLLLYFENLPFDQQMQELDVFYGIDYVITRLTESPDLLSLDHSPGDLSFWQRGGLLPDLVPFLQNRLTSAESLDEEQQYIIVRYCCKGLLDDGKPAAASEFLHERYPELKLDITNRVHLDLVYLIGEIACETGNQKDFDLVIRVLESWKQEAADIHDKNKFAIQQSMLFRKNRDYINEYNVITSLNIDQEQFFKDPDTNPVEVKFNIFPSWELLSEDDDPKRISFYMWENQTPYYLDREPFIPISHETYYMYYFIRAKAFETIPFNYLIPIDHENDAHHFMQLSLNAQSEASFQRAARFAEIGANHLQFVTDIELRRLFHEAAAFPAFYLGNIDDAKKRLNLALAEKPLDSYYLEYLVLIETGRGDIKAAAEYLRKIYHLDTVIKDPKDFQNLKNLYQALRMRVTEKKSFDDLLNEILGQKVFDDLSKNDQAKIYQDVGFGLADIGYLDEALDYFLKALDIVDDNTLKASILNNIGTVYSDMRNTDDAIDFFQKAIDLNPDNFRHHLNMAEMYGFKLDYPRAKSIIEAILPKFKGEDPRVTAFLLAFIFKMELLNGGILNLNVIENADAKAHFMLARQLMININSLEYLKQNTGYIFIALTNGFDCAFHSIFSSRIKEILKKIYPRFPKEQIPTNEWYHLNPGFRSLLQDEHISIGAIARTFRDFQMNSKLGRAMQDVKTDLMSLLEMPDMKVIENAATILEKLRNPSGHGEIYDYAKYIDNVRSTMIAINEFLAVVGKIVGIQD